MQGLVGDRFLKRLAGSLKRRRKRINAEKDEEKSEIDEKKKVAPDSHEPEEACGKEAGGIEDASKKDQTENQKN